MIKRILDNILYRLYKFDTFEKKLIRYDGYKENSILEWKKNSGISWKLAKKILYNLKIYSGNDIRNMLRQIVEENIELFERKNLYITSFGNSGKSGDVILYQFTHAMPNFKSRVKDTWEITRLPKGSTIVFLDDLIGTGNQSTEYINKKLNLMISPSFDCYLVCLCATEEGLKRVENETNFKIIKSELLNEKEYEYLSEECSIFSEVEKRNLKLINSMLSADRLDEFNKGLLLAFTHCVPNNTMPMIWKHNFSYRDKNKNVKRWKAILPRNF